MGTKCAFLMILAGSALAQTPAITLRIETASGRTQFRMGEAISLKLTFDNAPAGMWSLPGIAGSDRSPLGLGADRFLVSPEQGTSDPEGYVSGFSGSYLNEMFAGAKSISVSVDLNQWVRFDRAGQYRVSALIHASGGQQSVALNSNEIGIEIVPAEKEWSAEQLRQAAAVLDAPAATDQQAFNARASAVRAIWRDAGSWLRVDFGIQEALNSARKPSCSKCRSLVRTSISPSRRMVCIEIQSVRSNPDRNDS